MEVALEGGELRRITDPAETWFEISFPGDSWTRISNTRIWAATLPIRLLVQGDRTPESCKLRAGEREFRLAPGVLKTALRTAGTFEIHQGKVLHSLEDDREPAEETILSFRGRGGSGRLQGNRFSGQGIPVWPGEALACELDLPPASTLRFSTTLEPAVKRSWGAVTFRLRRNDETVFEHRVEDSTVASTATHAVELPRRGARAAKLTFEVEGAFAHTSFLAPMIGPTEVGRPGARPWGATRPDVILFLADTFRADNMAFYGSTLELTPNLDRLVAHSVSFEKAWSVGTFTLPSHATMFTGVFPSQADALSLTKALSEELVTIAELLSNHGYRTGAITDGGVVSNSYGMDQGFAYFDEDLPLPPTTNERLQDFLDADDGRPTFLFVHTYRTHTPYFVTDETLATHGERLEIRRGYEEVQADLLALGDRRGIEHVRRFSPPIELTSLPEAAGYVRELEGLYRGSAVDLDRIFATFLEDIESRGYLGSGYLVFTSDHGEAFGEHGWIYHGSLPHEEKTRIPLLITGSGLPPRRVSHAASLVDIPTTLASLAGVPTPELWLGLPLLELDRDRPVFTFGVHRRYSCFSVLDEGHKIIGFEAFGVGDYDLLEAYDLTRDPGESIDVAEDAEWAGDLLSRYESLMNTLLHPVVGSRAANLDGGKMDELRNLGYAE